MKYLLINRFDEIVDKVDLAGNVGKTGATTYFKGVKRQPDDKDFDKMWKMVWRNIREENPSMRLTKGGYQFLKNSLELKDYMVKLKRECKLKPEILLGLDKFITCPYYITNKEIYVFEEKLASELVLRAGDLDILIVSRR